MKAPTLWAVLGLAFLVTGAAQAGHESHGTKATAVSAKSTAATEAKTPDWAMNATIIEACSCPMFCQCYFSTKPAAHATAAAAKHEGHDHAGHGAGSEHFCRANNAFQVNKGSYGDVKLDGAKFWAAMDLGDDFSDGEMKWATIHFDPAVSKPQRDGIATILKHLYPVKFTTFTIGDDLPIEWTANKNRATAKLNGGKAGEVVLARFQGMSDEPIVIHNLKYWGAPRNDGFVLMPNEIEAYRLGQDAFEYKGTNGFMITFDISSKDKM